MTRDARDPIREAELVLPASDLDATVAFFQQRVGMRLDAIRPADSPTVAVLSGHGVRLRLDVAHDGPAGRLRVLCDGSTDAAAGDVVFAPNGTMVEFIDGSVSVVVPENRPVFQVLCAEATPWSVGRAGMRYRDLVPGRFGGRFIASHIHVPDGGPVADFVHFHEVRFQVIFCVRGWVKVVYEDQGPPFVMTPGDGVLQAPCIRHRVLECSDDLEVVEVGCPADHATRADHELGLPTPTLAPDRLFGEQRFVRHVGKDAGWRTESGRGRVQDTEVSRASGGAVGVSVIHVVEESVRVLGGAEITFGFVLGGTATAHDSRSVPTPLTRGASWAIPAGEVLVLADPEGLEVLEVVAPAPTR